MKKLIKKYKNSSKMEIKNNKLAFHGTTAEDLVKKFGIPLYVYDGDLIRQRYLDLVNAIRYPKLKMLYACKANSNPGIMKILLGEGCGIDAVSLGEVLLALKIGFNPKDILYTGNNTGEEELKQIIEKGVIVNIDSLSQMETYGNLNPNSAISVRINPDVGAGHHNHVITGGPDSKFGIYFNKINEIKAAAEKFNLKIIGLHMHVGSRYLDAAPFLKAMDNLLNLARDFHDLEFVDFGGGLGIAYSPDEKPIDINDFGEKVTHIFSEWCRDYGKEITMMFENGRFYVAEAGHLLVKVTGFNSTPKFMFVGVDSGFNHLIRPTMYGSYHEIINASNVNGEKEKVAIAGNLCESGDVFTRNGEGIGVRNIPHINKGDILSIENAGAYGFAMSSNYNLRLKPAEVLVTEKNVKLIRERQTFNDIIGD